MEFNIASGPWTTVFKGMIEGHSTEVYSNNKDLFLSMVFDEKNGKIQGALIEFFKVFNVEGPLEEFIETLPKDALSFNIHSQEKTFKFFILMAGPTYALYNEDDMINETNDLLKKLESTTKIILDVSKVYDLKIIPLDKAKEEDKQAFYAMPIISLLLHPVIKARVGEEVIIREKPRIVGEILLGKSKTGQLIREPFEFFFKSLVLQGKPEERSHALNVLLESAILSSISCIVFEFSNEFDGLSYPAEDNKELRNAEIPLEPIGMPVKEFIAGTDFSVDLSLVEPETIIEMFGLGDTPAAKSIMKALQEKKASNINELIAYIKMLSVDDEFNEFQKKKAIRILKLIELIYPNFFNGKINTSEMIKAWHKGLGKANIIKIQALDERQKLFIIHSLIKTISMQLTNEIKTMLFMPEANKIIASAKKMLIQEKIKEELLNCSKKGLGFVLSAKTDLDLPKEIIEESNARINIVEERDAGIVIKGLKQYRIILRPCLSNAK